MWQEILCTEKELFVEMDFAKFGDWEYFQTHQIYNKWPEDSYLSSEAMRELTCKIVKASLTLTNSGGNAALVLFWTLQKASISRIIWSWKN